MASLKTLTATEARKNLTPGLRAARDRHEIGIALGADIIALRPVTIQALDYPQFEFGVLHEQLAEFQKPPDSELGREREKGSLLKSTRNSPSAVALELRLSARFLKAIAFSSGKEV